MVDSIRILKLPREPGYKPSFSNEIAPYYSIKYTNEQFYK